MEINFKIFEPFFTQDSGSFYDIENIRRMSIFELVKTFATKDTANLDLYFKLVSKNGRFYFKLNLTNNL